MWIYAVPALVLLAVTLPHLGQGGFRTDTARYAAVGLQAWRDPALFWTPHLQPCEPYFNKPPLVFWIHGLFLHGCGVSVAVARIPSILAAIVVVMLTVAIARRWMGNATALAAGCVLALTYEFFRRTREISLDLWQLAFMLAGVWLYGRAAALKSRRRAFLAGIACGLALLCKPFMALLAAAMIFCMCRRAGLVLSFLAAMVLVAAPWHLSMVWMHGEAFVAQYLGREILQRAQGVIHAEPWWYYAVEMGRSYWPWWPALAAGVWHMVRRSGSRHHRAALGSALVWLAVWALALSCFPDKRPRYALPLYPAMALVAGYGLAVLPWRGLRVWYRRRLPLTAAVVVLLGCAAALLPLRVQAAADRDLDALIAWCRERPGETFYSAALSTNDEGYFYLMLGRWPEVIPAGRWKHRAGTVFLIYTETLQPKPRHREAVVFRAGPYCVTQP